MWLDWASGPVTGPALERALIGQFLGLGQLR